MRVRGTDFVVHYVPVLDEAVHFYKEILGLKQELYKKEWNWAEFSILPITLVLFGVYPGSPLSNSKGGSGLAIAVEDLDESVEELKEKGVEVEWGPNELATCQVAMISDPGGNPLFIHERKDGTWG